MQKGLPDLPEGKGLILFDGYCNLCNGAVQFIIKRDPKEHFRFSSLSWPPTQKLLEDYPKYADTDSILLYENGNLYQKSTAALKIAGRLKGLWPLMKVFFIIPRFLRDPIYDFIARNRYRWFGKKDTCMMPETKVDHLFISSE
ncbi:MAG TPA: DCC1-like thiol-disulfide oxidoreductase family protein [Cryomorphaceae bacterium]|nr:DCC1-like thiol-disulfide oxidoreductase family protein [Cryomorphaceae bacterium]